MLLSLNAPWNRLVVQVVHLGSGLVFVESWSCLQKLHGGAGLSCLLTSHILPWRRDSSALTANETLSQGELLLCFANRGCAK